VTLGSPTYLSVHLQCGKPDRYKQSLNSVLPLYKALSFRHGQLASGRHERCAGQVAGCHRAVHDGSAERLGRRLQQAVPPSVRDARVSFVRVSVRTGRDSRRRVERGSDLDRCQASAVQGPDLRLYRQPGDGRHHQVRAGAASVTDHPAGAELDIRQLPVLLLTNVAGRQPAAACFSYVTCVCVELPY